MVIQFEGKYITIDRHQAAWLFLFHLLITLSCFDENTTGSKPMKKGGIIKQRSKEGTNFSTSLFSAPPETLTDYTLHPCY